MKSKELDFYSYVVLNFVPHLSGSKYIKESADNSTDINVPSSQSFIVHILHCARIGLPDFYGYIFFSLFRVQYTVPLFP